jgi:hypothetical protein
MCIPTSLFVHEYRFADPTLTQEDFFMWYVLAILALIVTCIIYPFFLVLLVSAVFLTLAISND